MYINKFIVKKIRRKMLPDNGEHPLFKMQDLFILLLNLIAKYKVFIVEVFNRYLLDLQVEQ